MASDGAQAVTFADCIDRPLAVGDRVGVAFSYSRASVGYIKIGKVEILDASEFRVTWEKGGKTSPPMVFDSKRLVKL